MSCLRLVGAGVACVVANNRMGGKPRGITVFVENHDRLVFSGNNVFPDGYANVVLKNVTRSTVTGNQLESFLRADAVLEGACDGNAIVGNSVATTLAPGTERFNDNPAAPFPDDFGLIRIEGNDNVLAGTQISTVGPAGHVPVVVTGEANRVEALAVAAEVALDAEVALRGGSLDRENIVLGARPGTVEVDPGVWAIVQELPAPFRA